MDDIDAAFDDAYRSIRIEAGDDPTTLPNPYARPSLTGASNNGAGSSSYSGGGFIPDDDAPATASGGFIVEDSENHPSIGGGFVIDDDDDSAGAGGFLPDDDDNEGGFIPDNEPSFPETPVTRVNTIPLSAVPEALANLGLDSSDPSVLSLFAETAYTPSSASRRRLAPGTKVERVVGRTEFQQVASVLVQELQARNASKGKKRRAAAEEDEKEEAGPSSRRRPARRAAVQGRKKAAEIIDDGGEGGGGFMVDDEADDSEDDFETSRERKASTMDTGSDLSDDVDLADSSRRRRRPGRPAKSPSPSPSPSLSDDTAGPKPKRRRARASPISTSLNPLQRTSVQTLFSLLLDRLPPSTLPASQRRLGPTELTTILTSLNEKLPPKEVEEMVEEAAKLFASASDGPAERKSNQALKGAAAAQGILGASIGLDEFAGVLVHNRLL